MQDAHNTILNYDKDTSFFAVYDGHGGEETLSLEALEFVLACPVTKPLNVQMKVCL